LQDYRIRFPLSRAGARGSQGWRPGGRVCRCGALRSQSDLRRFEERKKKPFHPAAEYGFPCPELALGVPRAGGLAAESAGAEPCGPRLTCGNLGSNKKPLHPAAEYGFPCPELALGVPRAGGLAAEAAGAEPCGPSLTCGDSRSEKRSLFIRRQNTAFPVPSQRSGFPGWRLDDGRVCRCGALRYQSDLRQFGEQ